MSLSLDHVFIITEPGAVVADRILELGFIEGNANVHPGQGTSNRRFFLNGFMLELLYVRDADEAANGAGRGLGILERCQSTEASPYGLVVRLTDAETEPAFPNWRYFPDYFDDTMCFHVGNNSCQLHEPLCICMPPSLSRIPNVPEEFTNPDWQLTSLDISIPVEDPSIALKHFAAIDRVSVEYGKPHAMALTFNHGVAGKLKELTPDLPLNLKW